MKRIFISSVQKEFAHERAALRDYAREKSSWRPEKLARTEEMEVRYKNPDNSPRGP